MTIDEIEQEIGRLSDEERRLLLQRLQVRASEGRDRRVRLRGQLSGSGITEEDLDAVRTQWK